MAVLRRITDTIVNVRRTPAGVLIVPASLSRTGLQIYHTADGKKRVEYRPDSEVFSPEALDSVRGAVVTVGHTHDRTPPAVGLASDQLPARAKRDGEDFVETSLLITDQQVAARIERKDLTEISLDYYAEMDPTPGEHRGQKYDGRQTNIRVHSIALLPAGHARAGREARIRLDGNEELCNDAQEQPAPPNANADGTQTKMKIKIGDHVFDEGGAEHIAFLTAEAKREQTRADGLQTALTAAQAEAAKEKARADSLAAAPPPDVNALVQAELSFRDSVKTLLPADYKFEGKSREQVKRDAIGAEACKRVDAEPAGARRDAYLDATLAIVATQKKDGKPAYEVRVDAVPVKDANADFLTRLDSRYTAGRAPGSK